MSTNGHAIVRPIRAEDYPVLARIWDNPVDAVYDEPLAYPDPWGLLTYLALLALGALVGLALWWWLGGRT
jgi:hypothetical protein